MDSRLRRPTLGAICVVAALALGVAACGSSSSTTSSSGGGASTASGGASTTSGASAKKRTIAINMYTREIPYFQDIVAGADARAKQLGWTVDTSFGQFDPQLQFTQVQNAIIKHPDGIILAPIDKEAPIPVVKQAKAQNIDVVTVADDLSPKGQADELAYVGVQYVALGAQKAKWIADQLHGKGKVAIIHGIRGLDFTEAQGKGAAAEFKKYPGITLINGPYAGALTADKGLQAAQNVLTKNPDVNALYFDNDDIALGGIQAAKQRGLDMKKLIIIGTDGGAPALAAVKAGDLDYTISLCGYATGLKAIDVLNDKLNNNKTPAKYVPITTQVFTPSTIDAKLASLKKEDC
jgi:ABC-type sugar transport system substrate-binding protein